MEFYANSNQSYIVWLSANCARSDVVLSLLGAGEPVAKDDLNGCDAYYHYLEEKYK